jgi:hypothetical protein
MYLRRIALWAVAVGLVASAAVAATVADESPSLATTRGSRVISDKGFTGWTHWGPGRFEAGKAADKTIYITRGGMGLLWFEEDLSDFAVRFDFRVGRSGGNSGVFVRVPDPVDENHVHRSFEIQIDPEGTGTAATGAIYDVQPPLVTIVPEPGQWYRMRIVAEGDRIRVYIDGALVIDFVARSGGTVESYELHGYLGLQNHSQEDVVRFRQISLRETVA